MTKPITGRLLVRIQPQELTPRPIRVGVFVYLPRRQPFAANSACEGDEGDGCARGCSAAVFSSANRGARDARNLSQSQLLKSGVLASDPKALGESDRRDDSGNQCGTHASKSRTRHTNLQEGKKSFQDQK